MGDVFGYKVTYSHISSVRILAHVSSPLAAHDRHRRRRLLLVHRRLRLFQPQLGTSFRLPGLLHWYHNGDGL